MSYQFYQWLNMKKYKVRFTNKIPLGSVSDPRKKSTIVYGPDLEFAKLEACKKTDHNENEIIESRRI